MRSNVRRPGALGGPRERARPSVPALVLVTGTTALSTDTCIAALPALQASLHTTASVAQLTLTACIAGMAAGQILIGPVSDALGRRRLILIATASFAVFSAVCALTDAPWLMLLARAGQGVACGGAACVGRAVVTDTWVGRQAAARFGTLTAVGLLAPVVGPVVGAALAASGGWRSIFWFLALVGVLMCVAAWLGVPETLPPAARRRGGATALVQRTAELVRDPWFRSPVLIGCFVTGGFFIYIGGSSIVLQDDLGLSPAQYTAVFAGNATTMIVSSVLFRLLVIRLGPVLLRRAAVAISTTAVLALLVVTLLALPGRPALPVVWACLALTTFGLGTFLPANASIAQAAGRRYPGTASALAGGVPFLVGAATTPFTGYLGLQTVPAMVGGMAAFFATAVVLSVAFRRRVRSDALDDGPEVVSRDDIATTALEVRLNGEMRISRP